MGIFPVSGARLCSPLGRGKPRRPGQASQNPVADMVSIPVQSNFNFDYGQDRDKSQIVTNVQPVIPIALNKDLNLITRTIIPIIYTEYPAYQTGLGNVQFTGFLSPSKPGKFIWGFGPVFQFPTHRHLSWQRQMECRALCSWPVSR